VLIIATGVEIYQVLGTFSARFEASVNAFS